MSSRRAAHAGSWYTSNRSKLDSELSDYLSAVNPAPEDNFSPPIKGCKAIIAPHAGYAYSGPSAGWAYKSIDPDGIKRVFILGPSHHVYLDGCALSTLDEYSTPIGNLPLDLETIFQLRETGQFTDMSVETDEAEHSIELHLPFVRKVFEGRDISIVPILVGGISKDTEEAFGRLLAPYLASKDTLCVVSSDFCHWGTRFQFTHYYASAPEGNSEIHPVVYRLSRSQAPPDVLSKFPIHASIEALDREALRILTVPGTCGSAAKSHNQFSTYLGRTKNTICGRHPIGVLFGALAHLEKPEGDTKEGKPIVVRWVKYAQSSKCFTVGDSSVSYASAYVVF